MIQRIQSVYLFFISVFSILSLTGNFFSFSNDSGKLLISLFPVNPEIHVSGSVFPVLITLTTILLILIALLALITLFLFRNRKIQLKLTLLLIILTGILILVVVSFMFLFSTAGFASISLSIRQLFPLMMFIFSILGHRGIRKDEMLVRSYERLR
ncbi:MAG: DUF4293 domain-containing protein [Bacteroidetes bacterium]|nr:DUF4293 domain-containing protein [Bacteroidota bacterium]